MPVQSRPESPSAFPRRAFPAAVSMCMLFLVLFAAGCGKMVLTDRKPSDKPAPAVKLTPLDEAKNAFASGEYTRAETLALKLVEGGTLSGADSAEAGRVLAAAALQNKHPSVALTGLDHWRKVSAGVADGRDLQDAW